MAKRTQIVSSQHGQGMTEYIIIVALIAIAAIGVYSAFGDVVRGQTSVAASTLAGQKSTAARDLAKEGGTKANNNAQAKKTLNNFEEDSQ